MKQNEHKRVKHGHTPGMLNHNDLVRIREKKEPFYVFPWQWINEKCIKSFHRYIVEKSKKVQRRRDKSAIREGLDDV